MSDYVRLLHALAIDPLDWTLRKILADHCEESGLEFEAKFWRWTAEERKSPSRESEVWIWIAESAVPEEARPMLHQSIPDSLFDLMKDEKEFTFIQYDYPPGMMPTPDPSKTMKFASFALANLSLFQAFCRWRK